MTTTMNLSPELVLLDQQFADETAAITAAGQLLVDHGYVEAGYIDSMQERHALSTVSTSATMSRFPTEQSRLNHRSRKRGYRFYKYRKA